MNNPQIGERNTARIFIGARASAYQRYCQERSLGAWRESVIRESREAQRAPPDFLQLSVGR